MPVFTLLHTNDFHNQLTEAQANYLRRLRTDLGTEGILLDAGDAVSCGNITYHSGGEPILETMTTVGYDAMTVGNREFHFSRVGFQTTLQRAKFPVLCANIRPVKSSPSADSSSSLTELSSLSAGSAASLEKGEAVLPTQPFCLLVPNPEWKIVVLGLTVPMITERMLVRKVSAYVFDNPIEVAKQMVPELRARYSPDLLIALTHIGIQQDRLLAASVPGIDIIVGGHTHVVLEEGERVGETLIVQAGAKGSHWGRVHVEKGKQVGESLQLTARLERL